MIHILKSIVPLLLLSNLAADEPFSLIGGFDLSGSSPGYAAFLSSSGTLTPISTGLPTGQISSVAMNSSGTGILGGVNTSSGHSGYAAFVTSTGTVTQISTGLIDGSINSVSINNSGLGIIGGRSGAGSQPAYASLASTTGTILNINTGITTGSINSVAINSSGKSVIGGSDNTSGYAALVTATAGITPISTGLTAGAINSVAINSSDTAIIGGSSNSGSSPAFAAVVSSSGSLTPLNTGLTTGNIVSVAINDSGKGIIGGTNLTGANPAYAALVSSSAEVTPITTSLSSGSIVTVAINNSGQGIIGGYDSSGAAPGYAALVSDTGLVTLLPINLPTGFVKSVAINDSGQAVIGGINTSSGATPYVAIVSPLGVITEVNTGISSGSIEDVAIFGIFNALSVIPTNSLTSNNLIFANYINENSPETAFYFVPSELNGTLSKALESSAPTRNAISLYVAGNNLFYLTTNLSTHLRNQRLLHRDGEKALYASNSNANIKVQDEKKFKENTYSVWFEMIGAIASQKKQNQTSGFKPTSGGAILAFDAKTSTQTRVGGGATYLYTHIHEKDRAGHSNINQEDLFAYANWENRNVYFNGTLLGGIFQVSQTRKIHMTGFDFSSTSNPNGGELLAHIEFGYNYNLLKIKHDFEFTANPFAMLDWANAWQGSYKEKGDSPFNSSIQSSYSSLLRAEMSLRLDETLMFNTWDLIFQEKCGYVNIQSFGTGKTSAFLIGSPGLFTVETLTSPQILGVAELTMILSPHKANLPSTTFFYQGEFGSKYKSHQISIELNWLF